MPTLKFQHGLVLAGILVVTWNFVFVWIASGIDDGVVPSYEAEAR
jgi:hypothetical protein